MTNKVVRGASFSCQKAFDEFVAFRKTAASIRVVRAFFELSQAELAKSMGVSRKTVVALERGLVSPSQETVKKLDSFYKASGVCIKADDLKMTFDFASL